MARYRVESKLGEGGMGVVWKATDTTLGRTVALKVLPEAFARDPERVARFEREARVLASLNHPNIAAIYGLESDGPLRFLAMEFVPGDTLRDRLARGALPVPDALHIALKIAEALESAHERGIVHRDLKPANVAVTPDGDVKLLDFGLARAFAPDGDTAPRSDDSPTISAVMTRGDVILGTAAYMSPEQARGKLVDRRSDIWSFGLVLFEMLTGKTVFDGDSTTDLLAAVLRQDLPWERLPQDTPPHVRALLERCLERDPKLRLRDIGEARIVLSQKPVTARARRGIGWMLVPVGFLLVAAVTWMLARATAPKAPAGTLRTLEIASVADPYRASPALSPDGRTLAYFDRGRLWVRALDQLEPRAIASDAQARSVFWAPDSRTIGYISGTQVVRIPSAGGESEVIVDLGSDAPVGGEGAAWIGEGKVIVSLGRPDGLLEVPARGGEARTWLAADTTRESDFHEPSPLPGGRGVLVVAHRKTGIDNICLARAGRLTSLLEVPGQNLARPQYSPTGHLVFERTTPPRGVWAVRFSLTTMHTSGEPFLVVAQGSRPTVAGDGTLAYVALPALPLQFAWLDRTGAVAETLATIGSALEDGGVFDLSPDGTRALTVRGPEVDIWLYDFARGTSRRLTGGRDMDVNPRWTSDGAHFVYQAMLVRNSSAENWSVVRMDANGGDVDTLARSGAVLPVVSRDGSTLVFTRFGPGEWNLFRASLTGERNEVQLTHGGVNFGARFSPDGKWIAFQRSEGLPTPKPTLMLMPLDDPAAAVTIGTGLWPNWNERGDRLYFLQDDDVMEVTVGSGNPPAIGRPVRLFTRPRTDIPMVFDWKPQFAVREDRFLVLKPVEASQPAGIVLAENWMRR